MRVEEQEADYKNEEEELVKMLLSWVKGHLVLVN
jgi:hypothetical protein